MTARDRDLGREAVEAIIGPWPTEPMSAACASMPVDGAEDVPAAAEPAFVPAPIRVAVGPVDAEAPTLLAGMLDPTPELDPAMMPTLLPDELA
jgi:hypothetical protein